jgi:SAM-dependent methyltransferase
MDILPPGCLHEIPDEAASGLARTSPNAQFGPGGVGGPDVGRCYRFGVLSSEVVGLWKSMAGEDPRQGHSYLTYHTDRFESTYRAIAPFVHRDSRILTVGGGSCYVEAALRATTGASVTVLDFPTAIDVHHEAYTKLGFVGLGVDLTASSLELPEAGFDIILSSEVIEHVPASPRSQLEKLVPALAPNGHVVVTTPNLASLRNIVKLIVGRPLLLDADMTFSEVGYENEGIHRREYAPVEIERAMHAVGLVPQKRTYCWYHKRPALHPVQLAETAIPRLRECMIIHGVLPG